MQDETALGVHGAAGEHRLRGPLLIVGVESHLVAHGAEGEFRRPVHHHSHRAVLVVLAEQRHRAREVGVRERGQRDQQLVGQRWGGCRHGAILPGRHDARAAPQPIPNCSSSGVARRTSTTSTRARNGRPASGWLPSTVTVSASTAVTTTSSGPRSVCAFRSEEHTSELQSLMRISYAVFCLKNKTKNNLNTTKQ